MLLWLAHASLQLVVELQQSEQREEGSLGRQTLVPRLLSVGGVVQSAYTNKILLLVVCRGQEFQGETTGDVQPNTTAGTVNAV